MKMKFTLFLTGLLALLVTTQNLSAQTAGDYRSAIAGNPAGGDWTLASTWQTYNGTTWVAAATAPVAGTEVVTIQTGDSINLTASTTMDNVVVQTGAVLALFNSGASPTFTLNNGTPGNDLSNSGTLYVAGSGATLSGAGTLLINTGGKFILEASGTLSVNTINNGEVDFTNTAFIIGAILTNNHFINWLDGQVGLETVPPAAGIINNDSILVNDASTNFFGTGNETLTNASTGVIFGIDAGVNATIPTTIHFVNQGTVKGFGTLNFPGTTTNTGTVAPGNNSPAILSSDPTLLSTGSPTFQLPIFSSGAVAGANYSQIASTGALNLSGQTLTVTDAGSDAAGTIYTLVTAPSITGTFATVNLAPDLAGSLLINATSVTVQKVFNLPLTWGSFTVTPENGQASLAWSTLQESNTANFLVQRSEDGTTFTTIGTVKASGNTTQPTNYGFTDPSPALTGFDYYRLQEVDLDGHPSYSAIRVTSFGKENSVVVQTSPNPVTDLLNITALADNITITINDMTGRILRTLHYDQGFYQTSFHDFPAGTYQVNIYKQQQKIDSRLILKLQ
jgi:Secretion system C-terminal sorting domain